MFLSKIMAVSRVQDIISDHQFGFRSQHKHYSSSVILHVKEAFDRCLSLKLSCQLHNIFSKNRIFKNEVVW